ncbi:MAG: membrane protein insertase YidC [Candidatus Levybacteria bacterium]|nr:membrane protein insertase YidC [Candidatus Levybacteria bacterium]
MGEIFTLLIIKPLINALLLLYHGLVFVGMPYAFGFSIILLTVIIRLLLYPFTAKQLHVSKKMQELTPHLGKIKEKHKGDASRIQQESMRLYKEHGVNPASGCVPMIVQLVLLWGLYSVLAKVVGLSGGNVIEEINKLVYIDWLSLRNGWNQSFFSLPLTRNPSDLLSVFGPFVFLVPFVTGALQFIQTKMMYPATPAVKAKAKEKSSQEDFAAAFQKQSLYIFPIMIGFFSYTLPLGLALYWNTYTILGILQQYRLQGLGGLAAWFKKESSKKE